MKPLEDQILIRDEASDVKVGSIIIADERSVAYATVVSVSEGRHSHLGAKIDMPVKPGDRIIYMKGSGRPVATKKEQLKLLSVSQVLAVCEEGD